MNQRPSTKSFAAPSPSKTKFGGQKSLFWHPARMGNCPQSHLHRLHCHLHLHCCLPWWGGSSSPPGLRALPVAMWWRIDYTPLGTTRGRYDEHSSKSSLSCETKVYQTSRRKPNLRRWCLLASRQLRTICKVPRLGLCFAPAAIWNLHTTQPRTLPQLTMRLSISLVFCKQRIERMEW
jgi:hypothetical protein